MGGVSRNVCEVLTKLELKPLLLSVVGQDAFGSLLKQHMQHLGLSIQGIHTSATHKTAVYCCLLDEKGDLVSAVADMDILEEALAPSHVEQMAAVIAKAPIVFLDGNASVPVIQKVCDLCSKYKVPLFVDPTSVPKSSKFVSCLSKITFLKPNEEEVIHMAQQLLGSNKDVPSIEECAKLLVTAGVQHVLLSRGKLGIFHVTRKANTIHVEHYPAKAVDKLIKVTGAGDNFCAGFIFGITSGNSVANAINIGLRASKTALESEHAVNPLLSVKMVQRD